MALGFSGGGKPVGGPALPTSPGPMPVGDTGWPAGGGPGGGGPRGPGKRMRRRLRLAGAAGWAKWPGPGGQAENPKGGPSRGGPVGIFSKGFAPGRHGCGLGFGGPGKFRGGAAAPPRRWGWGLAPRFRGDRLVAGGPPKAGSARAAAMGGGRFEHPSGALFQSAFCGEKRRNGASAQGRTGGPKQTRDRRRGRHRANKERAGLRPAPSERRRTPGFWTGSNHLEAWRVGKSRHRGGNAGAIGTPVSFWEGHRRDGSGDPWETGPAAGCVFCKLRRE